MLRRKLKSFLEAAGLIDRDPCPEPAEGHPIILDYPLDPKPRYGFGKPPHPKLHAIIDRNRPAYRERLEAFLKYKDFFLGIPLEEPAQTPSRPHWINPWFPGLDAVALCGFLGLMKPRRYFEIGSGNSTKFARAFLAAHGLSTTITSFDPEPRAEIDGVCDRVVRQPVEEVDPALFDKLGAGDILFVHNSHRVFMNSDATVVFLDILPRLRPGVVVGFHDIFLPLDYPPPWAERHYSEQYLLAAYLLAEGRKFDIVFPSLFITIDPELSRMLAPLWSEKHFANVKHDGSSFWIEMR